MKTPSALLRLALFALAAAGLRAADIKHDFLAIDEGKASLFHVDENHPDKNWLVHVEHPTPRDMQLVGGNRIMIGHDAGYTEYDIATGKVVKDVAAYKGVTGARRLANGHTLVTGLDLADTKGVIILDLDKNDAISNKIVYSGTYVRLMRQTAEGTFLLMNDSMIREGDKSGTILHEWPVEGFKHAWKAVRLPNGHMFASAGYGAFLVELDADGKVVHKFAAKGETPKEINTNFYATFQLLPNHDVVVANWQGHGPTHGASGKQLVEFNQKGEVQWTWSDASMISSLQGVMVLDGLDTSKIYDERTGMMAPLN